jgi:hypothetical protein
MSVKNGGEFMLDKRLLDSDFVSHNFEYVQSMCEQNGLKLEKVQTNIPGVGVVYKITPIQKEEI